MKAFLDGFEKRAISNKWIKDKMLSGTTKRINNNVRPGLNKMPSSKKLIQQLKDVDTGPRNYKDDDHGFRQLKRHTARTLNKMLPKD